MNASARFKIKEPGQTRANVSRSKILEAAAHAFSNQAYESVSIREIAAKADVKHQLIAYHFGTKEELWHAVVSHLYQEFKKVGQLEIQPQKTEPRTQLRAHLTNMVTYIYERPEFFRIHMKELSNPGPRLEKIKELVTEFAKLSYDVFNQIKKFGIWKDIPNENLYFILSGAMLHRILYPEMNRLVTGKHMDEKQLELHVESIVNLFIPKK